MKLLLVKSVTPSDDGTGDNIMFASSGSHLAPQDVAHLHRRKGGGGGGHGSSGGKGGGGKGGSGGSSGGAKSPAASHGASSTFTNSRSANPFNVFKSNSKTTATAYSNGGGKPFTLGSNTPFNGRQAGGSSRNTIYGTSRFGSGYPYGGYGLYVDYRPFPYVFYPVPTAHYYYGGDEYLNVNDTDRPGGNLVYAILQPSWNTSSVTYRIVGDNTSVSAVFDALVSNCSVANSSSALSPFAPSLTTWPVPEQIVQYYRASTLALSLDGYNNTAALPSNMPTSNSSAPLPLSDDTPLPSGLNTTFLTCVNMTIGASIPLVDVVSKKLSATQIVEIVFLSLTAFILLVMCLCWVCSCLHKRKSRMHRNTIEHLADDDDDKLVMKPTKGRKWLSRIPFARRLGYRAIKSTSDLHSAEVHDGSGKAEPAPKVGHITDTHIDYTPDPPAFTKSADFTPSPSFPQPITQ